MCSARSPCLAMLTVIRKLLIGLIWYDILSALKGEGSFVPYRNIHSLLKQGKHRTLERHPMGGAISTTTRTPKRPRYFCLIFIARGESPSLAPAVRKVSRNAVNPFFKHQQCERCPTTHNNGHLLSLGTETHPKYRFIFLS